MKTIEGGEKQHGTYDPNKVAKQLKERQVTAGQEREGGAQSLSEFRDWTEEETKRITQETLEKQGALFDESISMAIQEKSDFFKLPSDFVKPDFSSIHIKLDQYIPHLKEYIDRNDYDLSRDFENDPAFSFKEIINFYYRDAFEDFLQKRYSNDHIHFFSGTKIKIS